MHRQTGNQFMNTNVEVTLFRHENEIQLTNVITAQVDKKTVNKLLKSLNDKKRIKIP